MIIKKAKIFKNGRSQAVRLPKEFRVNTSEVFVRKQGNSIILTPNKPTWEDFFKSKSAFGDDFLKERDRSFPQERDVS